MSLRISTNPPSIGCYLRPVSTLPFPFLKSDRLALKCPRSSSWSALSYTLSSPARAEHPSSGLRPLERGDPPSGPSTCKTFPRSDIHQRVGGADCARKDHHHSIYLMKQTSALNSSAPTQRGDSSANDSFCMKTADLACIYQLTARRVSITPKTMKRRDGALPRTDAGSKHRPSSDLLPPARKMSEHFHLDMSLEDMRLVCADFQSALLRSAERDVR